MPFFILREERLSQVQTLQYIIAPAVEALGFEFLGYELSQQEGQNVLRVIVDSLLGVSLDDCTRISRQVSAVLDIEDPISDHYNLEISSPGLERPLNTIDHYRRFMGRKAKVHLYNPRGGQRQICGIIKMVNNEEGVIIETKDAMVKIGWDQIERANLMVDFKRLKNE
ncbi:MAG: ribosome maturation factor RimP [Coxiella endosymbiont of Haemaphysalis qinghaiensis]